MQRTAIKYKINRNDPCLCGSGLKFKKCCKPILEDDGIDDSNYAGKGHHYFNKKNFKDAERYYRAHLTQYIIWYHEHTEPFRKARPEDAEHIFSIDIEALNEIADLISRSLFKQGKIDEMFTLYTHLSPLIDDIRYTFYIDTQIALLLIYQDKFKKAEKLLSKDIYIDLEAIPLTDMGKRALEIYLQAVYLRSPAIKLLRIIERVLDSEISISTQLHFLNEKVKIAFLHKDTDLAKKTALEMKKMLPNLKKVKSKERIIIEDMLPTTYGMLSIILNDSNYYVERIKICEKNIKKKGRDSQHIACQHVLIAQSYIELGENKKGKDFLLKAIDIENRPEYLLDLVRVNLRLDLQEEAIQNLESIDYANLTEELKIDYLSYYTDIALTNKDKSLAHVTEKQLAALEVHLPYLHALASGYRSLLLNFISEKQSPKSLLTKLRKFAAEKLILQPTIFGIGINLNELIRPPEEKGKKRK